MPSADWIQRYPGVLALLQQPDEEILYERDRDAPRPPPPAADARVCPCAWCQEHRAEA
jgi:hypothetical protein